MPLTRNGRSAYWPYLRAPETDRNTDVTGLSSHRDEAVRSALFAHLERLVHSSPDGTVRSANVNAMTFEGKPLHAASSIKVEIVEDGILRA